MSGDEDPFERLDESVGDRDGDPFEEFEDIDGAGEDDEASDDADGERERDPLGDSSDGDETATEAGADAEERPPYDAHDTTPASHRHELDEEEPADAPDPASREVVEVDEPEVETGSDDQFDDAGARTGDPFEEDVFEEMDVGELDPDEVWESITDAENRGSVSKQANRAYTEVSKHRYCEQCEFFSDPPDVACSHEGTEILEFVDHETVRVVDCPVVAEREELEKHE